MLTLVAMGLCWPPGFPLTSGFLLLSVFPPKGGGPSGSGGLLVSWSSFFKAPLLLLPRPLRTRSPMVLPLLDVDLLEEVGLETAAMEVRVPRRAPRPLGPRNPWALEPKSTQGARSDPPALWEPSDWSRFANARTRRAKERRASSATARNPASRQGCFRSPCETPKTSSLNTKSHLPAQCCFCTCCREAFP